MAAVMWSLYRSVMPKKESIRQCSPFIGQPTSQPSPKSWCMDSTVTESQCSVNLEYQMREHTAVIVTAAYIPPDANAKLAM